MVLPHVYVIHLPRLSERRRRLKSELKACGFTRVTWVEGVDGRMLDAAPPWQVEGLDGAMPWPGWTDPYARRAMTMGEVGCTLSHVRVWQQVAEAGEPAIVLEDDAMPVEGVIDTLPMLLNDLSYVDFDLVYLAQRKPPGPRMLAGRHVHVVDYHPLWTLAYLISAEAAAALLEAAWRTHLCPADEMLPAAFGLNDKPEVNARFQALGARVLSSHQRYFTPQEGSQDSQTEKSQPVRDPSLELTCLTVASEDTPELQRLCGSALRYGAEMKVLGLGKPWKGGDMNGPGGGQKINLLRPALKGLPTDRPVLFLDGYDTIVTRHFGDMLATWRETFDEQPVFAAEVTCWPDPDRANQFPVPEDESPYRFLNSGAFLGKAGDLRKIVASKIADGEDDQRYYTDRFLTRGNRNVPPDSARYGCASSSA